jgi:hypothetical protein
VLLVNRGRVADALTQLRRMEPQRLAWAGAELYSTEQGRVRRQLFRAESTLQDIVLTLALRDGGSAAIELAGDVMLRWKHLQGAEEAYLARLVRRSRDPRVRELAAEIAGLRAGLPGLVQAGREDEAAAALERLEAGEAALGRLSRDYQTHLQVQRASLAQLQAVVPPGSGLIELRQYWPFDFETGASGEPRWAGLLVAGFDEPVVKDLGPVGDSEGFVAALLQDG